MMPRIAIPAAHAAGWHLSLLALPALLSAAAAEPSKQGGICFRGDDNHTPAKWNQLAAVFEKHGAHVCASLNLFSAARDPRYLAFVKDLQARGHEVMDHSPSHHTALVRFASDAEASAQQGQPGVDHVRGPLLCFSYEIPAAARLPEWAAAERAGNRLRPADGPARLQMPKTPFVQVRDPQGAFVVAAAGADGWLLKSFWGEDLEPDGAAVPVQYRLLPATVIRIHPAGLRQQARLVQDLCRANGIRPPTTWIQPGGAIPYLSRGDLKALFGAEFGYTAGAAYTDPALKSFCEPDPTQDKSFGMQWGDFKEDDHDLDWNRKRIADGVALHRVLVGHSHLNGAAALGGWDGLLSRTDALLAWCRAEGIPVRTMAEWADILYRQPGDASADVMPALHCDRDRDGTPDGYALDPATRLLDSAAAERGRVLERASTGMVFRVAGLAGVEPGQNRFTLTTKSAPGTALRVDIRCDPKPPTTIQLTTTMADWERFEVPFVRPADTASVTLQVWCERLAGPSVLLAAPHLTADAR